MRGRIYPVDVKAPSPILRWEDWPDDVRGTLRRWNNRRGEHSLSFHGHRVFKCPDCECFCEPQPYGSCVLDGDEVCDECTITRARSEAELEGIAETLPPHSLEALRSVDP